MTERFVEVTGARLCVIDEGAGPPIVLLHAGIADLRSWDAIAPLLVAAGHRVVRYDARGFGRSTTEDVEFTHRADLLAVMDALGSDRAALVGNSRGGMLAFDTALESPERVVAVVGVAAGLGGFDSESTAEEEAVEKEYERVDKADPFDAAALTAFEVKVWVDGPLQPSGRVASAIRDLVHEMDLPLNEEGHITGRERRLDPPAVTRVGELSSPILAIAGELDFSGVAAAARHIEANAPNARAEIWAGVAHMIGMEQPERLASAITAFVAPLRPWS